jgi:hypothetical protein
MTVPANSDKQKNKKIEGEEKTSGGIRNSKVKGPNFDSIPEFMGKEVSNFIKLCEWEFRYEQYSEKEKIFYLVRKLSVPIRTIVFNLEQSTRIEHIH